MPEIDTMNRQMVGIHGDDIVINRPAVRMTKPEALAHAAWLVALADERDEFGAYFDTISNT